MRALTLVALLLSACGGVGNGSSPSDAVKEAMRLVDAGDLDGVVALTCDAQKDGMRSQLDLSRSLGAFAADMDLESLFDAVSLNTADLTFTDASVVNDSAQVQVEGTMSFSFDADQIRELFRQVLEQQGQPVDDATLDMLIGLMSTAAQSQPIDQTVDMVREDGSWKLCSDWTLLPG